MPEARSLNEVATFQLLVCPSSLFVGDSLYSQLIYLQVNR